MELRQLRYFVAVAEEQHFGRAAARLLIASPSLSQQIKALERDLGVTLFERSSKGAALTAAGEQLLPVARAALRSADDVVELARRIGQDRATLLRLGFLSFALTPVSRALLTEFGRTAPGITVQLRQYEWDDPSAGLLSDETDAAFVRPPFTGQERLDLLELGKEPVLAVVAEDHVLARRGGVTRAQLADQAWLETELVADPVFARQWYLHDLRDPSSAVRSRAATLEEWLAEIAFGRGINLIPADLAEQCRRPGLVFLPVVDAPPSRLVLAWRRGDTTASVEALARLAGRRRRAH